MIGKTRGIVLHHLNYRESSIIACIYTASHGRQSYIINSVRKSRSKIRMNLFQPLTRLDMDTYYNPGSRLQRLKEIRPAEMLRSIPFDMVKSTIALFLAEILYKTLREEERNPVLFEFLDSSVQVLDMTDEGIVNFHLVFLLHLSRHLGIYPDEETLVHATDHPELKETIKYLQAQSYNNLGLIRLNQSLRREILDWLVSYYYFQLDGMGKINSLSVLKEIFD